MEARLDQLSRPPKTPDNSSKPPSQGQKQDRPAPAADRPARKSRPGVGRTLHPNPDRVVDARLSVCPKCQAAFPQALQTPQQVYERIELPPIKPDVTQVRLFGGRCACCGERVTAEAPRGLEPGSPFGQSIAALVVYLHYAHAIGMERLAPLMDELFSLSISEGAISNMLARAREPLLAAAATIHATVLASPVVCSDETSARVKRQELVGMGVCRHAGGAARDPPQPRQGRGAGAVRRHQADGLGVRHAGQPARPRGRMAGLSGASAARCTLCCGMRRYCLQRPFRRLLLRAIAIGRRRDTLKDTTLKQYLADLDRRLDRIMAAVPIGEPGRKLRKRIAANRPHLFVFVTNRDVPYTNNVSERHLRPSVVFRKVTNGFRCEWGAETYAAFRSVVSTAKANGASLLGVLRFVLAAKLPVEPAAAG